MIVFLKELHLVLILTGVTEALIFKIKVVPCPFLITVLMNRFKHTRKIQSEVMLCTCNPRHASGSQEGRNNFSYRLPRKQFSYLFATV